MNNQRSHKVIEFRFILIKLFTIVNEECTSKSELSLPQLLDGCYVDLRSLSFTGH